MSSEPSHRNRIGVALVGIVGLALAAALLPFRQIEIVPVWTVQVLDEAGRPVRGLKVTERWEFYGGGPAGSHASLNTDGQGRVVFPAQSFRATVFGLLFGRAFTLLNVHASYGPSGSISAQANGFKPGRSHYSTNRKVYDDPGTTTVQEAGGFVTTYRFSPLDFFDFAWEHDSATMKRLIAENPATAKLRDRAEATPLIVLSGFDYSGQNAETIDRLLGAGAEINAQAKDGTSALHNAAKNHDIAGMELLLAKGANPKLKIKESVYYTTNGFTPLHFLLGAHNPGLKEVSAAQKIKGIDLLLAHGADVNAPDDSGNTSLHLAAEWGDPELVVALLARNADPEAKNRAGETPLVSIKELTDTPPVHQIRESLSKASARKDQEPARK